MGDSDGAIITFLPVFYYDTTNTKNHKKKSPDIECRKEIQLVNGIECMFYHKEKIRSASCLRLTGKVSAKLTKEAGGFLEIKKNIKVLNENARDIKKIYKKGRKIILALKVGG